MQTTTTTPQGSQALGFPVPQPNTATPVGPTPSLLTVTQSPGNVSGSPSAAASSVTLHSPATGSGGNPAPQDVTKQQREAIREAWIDAEGEISVLNKDDDSSLTPIRYGLLASKDPDGWKEGHGALLTDYFVVVTKGETKNTKSSHIIRPIPLECLRLASFNHELEVRKQDQSILMRIACCSSSPPPKDIYPFTIYHVAGKITRRYTLYTESATERNKWHNALREVVESQKAKQHDNPLYAPQTLDDKFFRVPPRTPLAGGGQFTGEALCAAEFSYQGGHYLAVGCTNGIYVRDRSGNSPFQSVLESDKPTSVAAIPESNAFLVHCESRLFSYRLDHIIRVSQGDTGLKNDGDWETKLAEDHGEVLSFKAGRMDGQTLKVVYSAKSSKQVTSYVLKVTCLDEVPQYKPLGSPMSTPGDPEDITFLTNEVAICTLKAIYFVKPAETTSFRTVVPELPNSKRSTNVLRRALKGTQSLFGETKKSDPVKVLGLVEYGNKRLIVYDGLGYFMDEDGKPTRPTYYISWECMATAYARRGSHLLLFSSGFIEVRNVDTGELIRVMERRDVRHLRCGWTEHRMLLAATAGDAANDGSRKENLVELV